MIASRRSNVSVALLSYSKGDMPVRRRESPPREKSDVQIILKLIRDSRNGDVLPPSVSEHHVLSVGFYYFRGRIS